MTDRNYIASKSQTQGRAGWAVIFRHPVRLDGAGKPGRRARRGLGHPDPGEADRLVAQLNEVLRTRELWDPAARSVAAARFDARVVDIFYDGIEPSRVDFESVRDQLLPLPPPEAEYRSVLLL